MMEGYLTHRMFFPTTSSNTTCTSFLTSTTSVMMAVLGTTSSSWVRRYVTINRSGQMYLYANRQTYRLDPKKSILNNRPIDLKDHYIHIDMSLSHHKMPSNTNPIHYQRAMEFSHNYPKLFFEDINEKQTDIQENSNGKEWNPSRLQMVITGKEDEDNFIFHLTKENNELIGSSVSYPCHYLVLRCDTEEEWQAWVQSIMEAIPSSSIRRL